MGSKKLKALVAMGSGKVAVADPERLQWLYRTVGEEARSFRSRGGRLEALNAQLAEEGGGRARLSACTSYCPSPCRLQLTEVQGAISTASGPEIWPASAGSFRGAATPASMIGTWAFAAPLS
jgi:hypothetical protein